MPERRHRTYLELEAEQHARVTDAAREAGLSRADYLRQRLAAADRLAARPPTPAPLGERPRWLEPLQPQAVGRAVWREALYAEVCRLASDYPEAFATLGPDWTERADRVRVLGALVAWRSALDSGGEPDFRSELAFYRTLTDLSHLWSATGDIIKGRFDPRRDPPAGWDGTVTDPA